MLAGRYVHTATLLLNGQVLVAGGHPGLGSASSLGPPLAAISPPFGGLGLPLAALPPQASAELYDPASGSWAATGSMIETRSAHTATLLPDGTVLVAGGSGSPGQEALASAERYDPATGIWTATGAMIEARFGHTASLLSDGTVLVAGGLGTDSGGDYLASAEVYDPITGIWTATGAMIEARFAHTATKLLDGTVLVAGGSASASAELYDPGSRTWTAGGSMSQARSSHTATLLNDGTVLVAGGFVSFGTEGYPGASAELYDPATGTWTATGSMIEARQFHTATLLPGGIVLVVGDGAELYDPNGGTWAATVSMIEARSAHSATLLRDGTVLAAGGSGGLSSAELYDPGSGS